MKTTIIKSILLVSAGALFLSPVWSMAMEKRDISSKEKALVVYHFDEPDIKKKIGVDLGTWELHPSYITDITVVAPTDEKEREEFGNILKISYDVSFSEEDLPYASYPVYNGAWFHLADADLSDYDTLVFYAHGDSDEGFTRRFKVELKNNSGEIGRIYINDIGNSWRRLVIPIAMIKTNNGKQMKDLKSMKELTVVFEKEQVTSKKGVIYLDNIYFSGPKDGVKPANLQTAAAPSSPPAKPPVKKK